MKAVRDAALALILLGGIALLLSAASRFGIIEIVVRPRPVRVPQSEIVAATASTSGPAVPSRIVANAIGLDAQVAEMGWQQTMRWGQIISEWNIPAEGAGWHRNSARPGEGDNVVISGHNNSAGNRVFANLEELAVGDEVTVWDSNGQSFVYRIDDKQLIRVLAGSPETWDHLEALVKSTAQEQLTLITCWPRWSNTHRLILVAKPL